MNEVKETREPQIKIENVVGFDGIHVWYSKFDKVVLIRLDTTRWRIDVESDGRQFHIHTKEEVKE